MKKLEKLIVVLPSWAANSIHNAGVETFFKERVYIDAKVVKKYANNACGDKEGIDRWRLRLAYMTYCKTNDIYPVTGQSFAHACRSAGVSYWGRRMYSPWTRAMPAPDVSPNALRIFAARNTRKNTPIRLILRAAADRIEELERAADLETPALEGAEKKEEETP